MKKADVHRAASASPRSPLRAGEHEHLTTDEAVRSAAGVSSEDRIEVAPVLPEGGRISFVTSDPRAIDLEAFRHLARGGDHR